MRYILCFIALMFITPAAHAQETVVATAGDSITYGVLVEHSYSDILGIESTAKPGAYFKNGPMPSRDLEILRFFKPGVRSMQNKPDVIVALIGINDMVSKTVTDRQIKRGYRQMQLQAQSMGIKLVFGTITPVADHSIASYIEPQRQRINAWIRRMDDYVDYAAALEMQSGLYSGSIKPWLVTDDGLHPNQAGNRVMANTLEKWMKNQ